MCKFSDFTLLSLLTSDRGLVVEFAPVGNHYFRDYCILSVHSCVLFLVHILGRCYETEKKLL